MAARKLSAKQTRKSGRRRSRRQARRRSRIEPPDIATAVPYRDHQREYTTGLWL